jgi:hypothetical protein
VISSVFRAALLAVALAGCQSGSDANARLEQALERMDALKGVRFELTGEVQATGRDAPGGDVVDSVRVLGDLVPPDRLLLTVDYGGSRQRILIVADRVYVEGAAGFQRSLRAAAGPLREARAALQFVRGPGHRTFAGVGFARGTPTYRVRIDLDSTELQARVLPGQAVDPDAHGAIEVEIGLLDGLIRRHTLEINEATVPFGHGLSSVRTTYAVEYWDFDRPIEIAEPD